MALKWINTAAFVAMIAVNALAELVPIGGSTTAGISEAYPNLFTPAPATFAIWSLIYLLMAVFVVYQWGIIDKGEHSDRVRNDIGLWFAAGCVLNIVWILCWHGRAIGLSVVCIILLLIVQFRTQRLLGDKDGGFLRRLAAGYGFSVYYGWMIAATMANILVLLAKIDGAHWGMTADIQTVATMLIGAAITAAAVLAGRNGIAGVTVMWAYAGILLRHISPGYLNGAHPYVISAGILSEALMLTSVLLLQLARIFGKRRYIVSPTDPIQEKQK